MTLVNESFRPSSSGHAATRTSFASLIGRMSQTAHSGDLDNDFAASVFSSNLLLHCFVRDFIQDNGVCNVLNEIDRRLVANFRKAGVRGVAINHLGFCITITTNTDSLYFP